MKLPNISFKKVCILCAVLLLSIALGTGMNKAFAGQNIQSLFTSWFITKKEASIEQIDQAIASEKERLMGELREAIREEILRADAELAQFTAEETALRVKMLQDYAANLLGGLQIDLTDEKAAIIADLDAALAEAMAQLDYYSKMTPPVSNPNPGGSNGNMPETNDDADAIGEEGNLGKEKEESEETDGELLEEEKGTAEGTNPDAELGEEIDLPIDEETDEEDDSIPADETTEEEERTEVEEPIIAVLPIDL
ncbi:hypothetical protein ACFQ38_12535 [Sporosarcina contaminans]|uniref:Uncharacterized protein n=1 Tax=Sporosarcina contaminans TaxID=633403 RepID=A0ABW3U2T1_9BACL